MRKRTVIIASGLIAALTVGGAALAASAHSGSLEIAANLLGNTTEQALFDLKSDASVGEKILSADTTNIKEVVIRRDGGKAGFMDMADAAALLGISEADLKTKLGETTLYALLSDAGKLNAYKQSLTDKLAARMQEAVTAGKLTQAQADELLAKKKQAIESWDGSKNIAFDHKVAREREGFAMKDAASILGLTDEALKEKLATSTLGALLKDAGKLDEYKAAALQAFKDRLNQEISGGKLTQAEADQRYAAYESKLKDWDGSEPIKRLIKKDAVTSQ